MPAHPEDIPAHAGADHAIPLRVGPGRYVLAADALADLDRHLASLGASSAYVLGGDRAYAVARDRIEAGLERAGIDARYAGFGGECHRSAVFEHREQIERSDPDVVLAVGGGKAIDTAKLAAEGRCPVAAVPTSPATCAAWTALSVVYELDGTYRTGVPLSRPPALVVADLGVLVDAPARLFANGVMDASAKHFETRLQRAAERPTHRWSVGLAEETYLDDLRAYATEAYDDVRAGRVTPAVENAVESVLAGPGLAAGLLSDRSYVGFPHVVCYALLGHGAVQERSYHGERVAYGVVVLQALLGESAAADPAALLSWYGDLGADLGLQELGVETGEDAVDTVAQDVDAKLDDAGFGVDASQSEIAAAMRRVERL